MRAGKYEKILSMAAYLIARKGYEGTSLQDIADKVGLQKTSLFHYFNNKEELLLKILEKPVNEVNRALEEVITDGTLTSEQKLRKAIGNHLRLLTRHLNKAIVYLDGTKSLSRRNRASYIWKRKEYERNFETIVAAMMRDGYFAGGDVKIATFGILGMLNWTARWYRKGGPVGIEQVSNIFASMILNGEKPQGAGIDRR